MLNAIDRAISALSKVAGGIAALLLVYILAHIVYEIILRSFFASSTFVLDEFVGYAVAGMTFLSLGYALDKGSLIRVDIAVSRLGAKARRIVELICITASFSMVTFCAYWIGRDVLRNLKRGAVSESIAEVPLWIPIGVVWLGLVLLMLQLIAYFIRIASGGTPLGSGEAE